VTRNDAKEGAAPSPASLAAVAAGRSVRPRTDGQARYVHAMRDNDVTFAIGPAGTGKSYLAVAQAVTMLRQGVIKKIVLVRPAVEAGEKLGFLPGDIAQKINPYLRPLLDALNDMMEPEQVKRYMENDIIEIAPLAFMRGRTLNSAVIILDEGQNTTIPQMQMFLTRMGHGSKIVVTGDITQIDLPKQTRSGLVDAVQRLKNLDRIGIVHLGEQDIVRHPLVQAIVKAYEDDKPRRRKGEG
jgi:phosphate starvation-inducible PhoH-like protein